MPAYKVRAGDTIAKIAKRFCVSMDTLVRLNDIKNPDRILVGMELQIPDVTTDAMDAVSFPVEQPAGPTEATPTIPINRSKLVLPSKEYYPEVMEKDLVVLHFTSGQTAQSAFDTWVSNPEHVATAYIVDRDGSVYELFDPSYWAYHLGVKGTSIHDRRSVGIEIANVGPLKPVPDDPNRLNWWPHDWGTPWCRLDETDRYVRADYRGIGYFASFPDAQLEAVSRIAAYVCERFGIPKTIPPRGRRGECDLVYFADRKGVVAHQNFRKDKWDVGPAFNWDRLGF